MGLNLQVILVSHSIGGGSMTAAMCSFPHRVSMVVYVAAAMVEPGSLVPPRVQNTYMGVPEEDDEDIWDYIYGNGTDKARTSMMMKPEYIRQKYYNQSPMEVIIQRLLLEYSNILNYCWIHTSRNAAASNAYQCIPRHNGYWRTPVIDNIPRVYMKIAKDYMFSPSTQDIMVTLWPPSQMFVLEIVITPHYFQFLKLSMIASFKQHRRQCVDEYGSYIH